MASNPHQLEEEKTMRGDIMLLWQATIDDEGIWLSLKDLPPRLKVLMTDSFEDAVSFDAESYHQVESDTMQSGRASQTWQLSKQKKSTPVTRDHANTAKRWETLRGPVITVSRCAGSYSC
ncbi:hypothetical protein J1614_005797 [Plenodomus biglobosus]|nr:hypothetical protein J1614_005797 [Plenodomus biglobosus]